MPIVASVLLVAILVGGVNASHPAEVLEDTSGLVVGRVVLGGIEDRGYAVFPHGDIKYARTASPYVPTTDSLRVGFRLTNPTPTLVATTISGSTDDNLVFAVDDGSPTGGTTIVSPGGAFAGVAIVLQPGTHTYWFKAVNNGGTDSVLLIDGGWIPDTILVETPE